MHDTGGTGRAAVDLAEALIVALEEACSPRAHRWLLPYLGMARAELAQCRPGGPGRAVRLHDVIRGPRCITGSRTLSRS